MSDTKTGGPAFPTTKPLDSWGDPNQGMTLRQYAAIKLKVPDSGEDWLDAMIEESLRDDFAAKAMNAFLSRDSGTLERDAEAAYKMADAMLKARSQ